MKKRLLTLLLALALAVSLALPAAAAQTPVEVSSALELAQAMAEPVPARGRFRSRAAAAEPTRVVAFAPALADGYGADRVLHLAAWQEYVLEFSDAAAAQRALARLRSDPDVTDCFLDEAVTADDTLAGLWDETASRSWGGHEMGLTTLRHQADVLLPAGRRATVAVIDTGAEVSHPLLAGRVSARSYDFADNTADVTDVNGHGTATAGLIADLTPDEVDVMVLRVYGDDNLSKPSRVLTALEYALENGATVVNMSIGWPNAIEKGYSFLNSVLAQAYAAGVVVVAAAGNLSRSNPTANADDVYPANQAQVLTVSAVDRSRTFDDTYSASGASVDLCAPGTGVAVAALSGGMTVRSGTSFAAPHVAAAAACVQLAQPGATAARVRRTLCDYAEDLGAPGRDDQYGNGFPVLTQCFHDRLCPGRRFADMPDADAWSHAGLDYWHYLDISYYDGLDDFFAKNNGPYYYFTTKAPLRYTDVAYPDGAYLVFGREDAGLPEALLAANQEHCIRMPMRDTCRSLNLSNSVAVGVYEVLRQWDFPELLDHGHLRDYEWK